MTNPVSVDGELDSAIEQELWRFIADAMRYNAGELNRLDLSYARLRTAILKHDPVVAYLAEELALEDPANPAVLAWREAVSGDSR